MNNYQFSLFGFARPRRKVPISAAEVIRAKECIAAHDSKGAVEALRNIRYKLQAFEQRINTNRDV